MSERSEKDEHIKGKPGGAHRVFREPKGDAWGLFGMQPKKYERGSECIVCPKCGEPIDYGIGCREEMERHEKECGLEGPPFSFDRAVVERDSSGKIVSIRILKVGDVKP
jgi:hypothetical protein